MRYALALILLFIARSAWGQTESWRLEQRTFDGKFFVLPSLTKEACERSRYRAIFPPIIGPVTHIKDGERSVYFANPEEGEAKWEAEYSLSQKHGGATPCIGDDASIAWGICLSRPGEWMVQGQHSTGVQFAGCFKE